MKHILLPLLLLLGFCSFAQDASYGVTTALQTLPPFTQNISDWADPLNDKIGLTLLLNDRNEPGYQVQLRLTIEGQGVRLETSPDWTPSPINLSYGLPAQLTGIDLAEYFDLDHLRFSGISREQYLSLGGLPEGSYTICFETYDWIRNGEGPSSPPACAIVQARLLDPPVILAPLGVQQVISPQMLLVQWQARHTANFMTNYKVEIYPQEPGLTAEQIFALQQPYIETEVSGITSLLVDASFPSLRRGINYFVRVQALDPMGESPFKNGGYSELAYFTYGEDCQPPGGLTAKAETHSEASLGWDFQPGSGAYVVRYREKNPDAHWYEEETLLNFLRLTDLLDNTLYEVQLQSVCDGSGGEFGPTFEFTTPERPFDPSNADCGTDIETLPLPTNTVPISRLSFGSRVKVGQFDFRVTEATAAGGNQWQGKGEMDVPWLGAKIACTFENLSINTDGVVFAGEVLALDNGLPSVEGMMTKEEVIQQVGSSSVNFCGTTLPSAVNQDDTGPGGTLISSGPAAAATIEGASLPFVMGEGNERIAFYGMRFGPTAAVMSAFSSAKLPIGDRVVAFAAEDFGFQPGGLQGNSKLSLVTDLGFDWSGKMKFTLRGSENTFIGFDCSGITEVGLQMEVDFCRDIAVPIDPATGKAAADEFVTATFSGVAPSWEEFAGEISVSPFELPKLPGWTFTVQEAILDMADAVTPATIAFPEGYNHPDVGGGTEGAASPAWKGFYLSLAEVSVPKQFTSGGSADQGITIGARQLIIDDTGFSGSVFGKDVLSLEQGRAGSWALSLDEVAITVQSNQFEAANLEGMIEVPAFDEPLAYHCNIQPGGSYAFSVAVEDEITMSAMVAEVSLFANTKIGLEYDEAKDEFEAYAKLFGEASFSPSLGDSGEESAADSKLNIPKIGFEDFHLSSQAPFIVNIGSWALSSEENQPIVAGFPLQINEVSMLHNQELEQVAFGLDLTVNLVNEKDKGFGANGRAFIICDVKVNETTQKQDWTFNKVRLDKLALDYVGSGFEFHGFLQNFADDPTFGSGFSGGIQASFKPGIQVGAVALFGQKNDFRYFFADAKATFNPGIAIGTTGMALYGFGGGVSYHMDRLGFEEVTAPVSDAEGSAEEEEGADAGAETRTKSSLADAFSSGDPADGSPAPVEIPGDLGTSLSGVRYVPNAEVGLGLKAMVAFGTTKREVFNGDLTFEILFNDDGALRQIGLLGNANFLTPPKSASNPSPTPAIGALVDMTYDFQNEAFDAYLRMKVFINQGVISGAYPDFVAGEGKIHADADDWYIHLGTPTQPIKLSYDLSKIANAGGEASSATAGANPLASGNSTAAKDQPLGEIGDVGMLLTAYLDAGTVLPPFPDPPQEVMDILNKPGADFNPTGRDDPAFANAEGLLFGAGFELSMPDLKFLIFYAYVNAGMGFDMQLKNYGERAICSNMTDSPDPIGINGWYATGQFYGYLEAGVGVEVDLLGFQGKYPIFDVGVAALLQARMPNPMWMKGELAGEYSILGGLVSGNCQFEFEAGTQCDISESGSLSDLVLIEYLTPDQDETEANVFTQPQAGFAFSMDKVIVMKDDDENNIEIKPRLASLNLKDGETGAAILGEIIWNSDKTVAAFKPSDILPGQRSYSLKATVELQKRVSGRWVSLFVNGKSVQQTKEVTFTTGDAPKEIVEENVRYAYPINRQLNFHRAESNRGYVQLDQGQDYLFLGQTGANIDASEWKQVIRFKQGETLISTTPFTYDGSRNRLSFSIPSGQLGDDKISSLEVVNIPLNEDTDIDANIEEVERDLAANLPDGVAADQNTTTILVKARRAKGNLIGLQEKQVYHLNFRTSRFSTFSAKAASMVTKFDFQSPQALTTPRVTERADGTTFTGPYLSINDFGRVVISSEAMDVFELKGEFIGGKDIAPMVRGVANLNSTQDNWYNVQPKINMYDRFPQPARGLNLSWRTVDPLGHPPARAIVLRQRGGQDLPRLTDTQLGRGAFPVGDDQEVQISYHLPYIMYRDYADYWNQVGNFSLTNELPLDLRSFYDWDFLYPPRGTYEIRLEYFLPGQTTPISEFTTQLIYHVPETRK